MRTIGIDLGDKHIGVAATDPLKTITHPLTTVERCGDLAVDIEALKKVIEAEAPVDEIVIGLPKKLSGQLGPQAEKVLAFISELQKVIPQKIVTWDERLTTVEAERELIDFGITRKKRKKIIDSSAAAIILKSYLDNHHQK